MEKICVIIPCYNEASRIRLDVFRDFLREQDYIDFCFVNDGSRDNTSEVLRYAVERCPERFLLVDNPDNRGKAEAVRSGMLHVASLGRYDLIGFLDADLATPLEDIHLLVEVMRRQPSVMMTMGARLKRLGANVQRKVYRHYMGRVLPRWFPCCSVCPCTTASAGRSFSGCRLCRRYSVLRFLPVGFSTWRFFCGCVVFTRITSGSCVRFPCARGSSKGIAVSVSRTCSRCLTSCSRSIVVTPDRCIPV